MTMQLEPPKYDALAHLQEQPRATRHRHLSLHAGDFKTHVPPATRNTNKTVACITNTTRTPASMHTPRTPVPRHRCPSTRASTREPPHALHACTAAADYSALNPNHGVCLRVANCLSRCLHCTEPTNSKNFPPAGLPTQKRAAQIGNAVRTMLDVNFRYGRRARDGKLLRLPKAVYDFIGAPLQWYRAMHEGTCCPVRSGDRCIWRYL